jgi:hypothetical protein
MGSPSPSTRSATLIGENEIDEALRSDEPAGEKLSKLVDEHSEACDEIKEKLECHKEKPLSG